MVIGRRRKTEKQKAKEKKELFHINAYGLDLGVRQKLYDFKFLLEIVFK